MAEFAVYPGSFDPFTSGHMDIVKKAARLFERVYIVIGVNADKKRVYDAEKMKTAIEQAVLDEGISNCVVCVHAGLTAAFAEQNGARYMVRGLRNNLDYNYEENIAEINKLISPALETVYFRADRAAVSSSMVRELRRFGQDASGYVPAAVLACLNACEG